MNARNPLLVAAMLSLTTIAACSANVAEEEGSSSDRLTRSGGTTRLDFLGSSAFLIHCARAQSNGQHVLGCGALVSSVPDSTPYFSAPWPHSACNQTYTVRLGSHCVEAQRLEVSDSRGLMEGNPGLFDALGLAHSTGSACHGGFGGANGVTFTPGRHCNEAAGSSASGAKSSNDDGKGDGNVDGTGDRDDAK